MTKIFISSVAAALNSTLTAFEHTASVEAEFGDILVPGTLYTLAHHGARSVNPVPCTLGNEMFEKGRGELEAIGLSHLDLDALGGVLALLGVKPEAPSFWELAGKVDVNGLHKLAKLGGSAQDIARLHAWHAWSEQHRCFPPRPKANEAWGVSDERWVSEIGAFVEQARLALVSILKDDPEMLAAGVALEAKNEALNKSSFVEMKDGVVYRRSEAFVNHLYTIPNFEVVARACVSYNPKTKAVTLSLADPIKGISCGDIAKQMWGEQAGGHAGIAGGPRSGLEEGEARYAYFVMQRALFAADGGMGFVALPRS